jgi:hypothetical protein
MKKVIMSAAFILLLVVAWFAQETCTRHHEAAGGFSYCPPPGWSVRDSSTGPHKSFFTPSTSSFRANFNVKTETTSLGHDAYMSAALQTLLGGNESRGAEARKIIGWTKFRTDSNITGSRMEYETLYKGSLIRTIQIILDLPGKKLLITGTTFVADKDVTDKIFDGVARTLVLSR